MVSRSIILHLKAGDKLTLEKRDFSGYTDYSRVAPETATDKEITFCVSMKHLDEALTLGMASFSNLN
jgi:hypothetical protein